MIPPSKRICHFVGGVQEWHCISQMPQVGDPGALTPWASYIRARCVRGAVLDEHTNVYVVDFEHEGDERLHALLMALSTGDAPSFRSICEREGWLADA
jgi:hypothetical protein